MANAQPISIDLTGRVLDASLKPVSGAKVSLFRTSLSAETGVDGRFTLKGTVTAIHHNRFSRNLGDASPKGYHPLSNQSAHSAFALDHEQIWWSVTGQQLGTSTPSVNTELTPANRSVFAALAKAAAIDDTLRIEKNGFGNFKLSISSYSGALGDLTLKLPIAECGNTSLPTGALLWVRADEGIEVSGGTVTNWANKGSAGGFFKPTNGPAPKLESNSINGKPSVIFDGKAHLDGKVKIVGLPEMTLGMVTATTADYLARPDWCQNENVPRNEHGCSGTFFNPIMWIENGGWGYTYVGPAKEHISFRFGPGASTYQLTKGQPDPGTGWTRPKSIGEAFTYTVGIKSMTTISMLVEGQEVFKRPIPGKAGPIMNVTENVELGSGRTDSRDPTLIRWAGKMAEVFAFPRVLSPEDIAKLNAYINCRYFP